MANDDKKKARIARKVFRPAGNNVRNEIIKKRGVRKQRTRSNASESNKPTSSESRAEKKPFRTMPQKPADASKSFRSKVGTARKVLNKTPVLNKNVANTATGKTLRLIGRKIAQAAPGAGNILKGVVGNTATAIGGGLSLGLPAGNALTGGASSDELQALANDHPNSFVRGLATAGYDFTHPLDTIGKLSKGQSISEVPPLVTPNSNPIRPNSSVPAAIPAHRPRPVTTTAAASNAHGDSIPELLKRPVDTAATVNSTQQANTPQTGAANNGLFNGATRLNPTQILDKGNIQTFGLSGPNGTVLPAPRGKGTFNVEHRPEQPKLTPLQQAIANIRHDKISLDEAGNPRATRIARTNLATDFQLLSELSKNPQSSLQDQQLKQSQDLLKQQQEKEKLKKLKGENKKLANTEVTRRRNLVNDLASKDVVSEANGLGHNNQINALLERNGLTTKDAKGVSFPDAQINEILKLYTDQGVQAASDYINTFTHDTSGN